VRGNICCFRMQARLDPGFFTLLVANEEGDGRETHGRDNSRGWGKTTA
jgi:hypothetical protein